MKYIKLQYILFKSFLLDKSVIDIGFGKWEQTYVVSFNTAVRIR